MVTHELEQLCLNFLMTLVNKLKFVYHFINKKSKQIQVCSKKKLSQRLNNEIGKSKLLLKRRLERRIAPRIASY